MNQFKLDARGQHCPMPIVNLAAKIKDVDVGDEVLLIADESACVQDLPAWCNVTGNQLVSMVIDAGTVHGVVRRTES